MIISAQVQAVGAPPAQAWCSAAAALPFEIDQGRDDRRSRDGWLDTSDTCRDAVQSQLWGRTGA
jgi:hypothetical protein